MSERTLSSPTETPHSPGLMLACLARLASTVRSTVRPPAFLGGRRQEDHCDGIGFVLSLLKFRLEPLWTYLRLGSRNISGCRTRAGGGEDRSPSRS